MIRKKWEITKEYKKTSTIILQDQLAALRAKLGITQEEIANIIGVSRQTYYSIENNDRSMSWDTFMALIFFFSICGETAEMLRELRVYPTDLIMRFNDQVPMLEERQRPDKNTKARVEELKKLRPEAGELMNDNPTGIDVTVNEENSKDNLKKYAKSNAIISIND